MEQISPSRVNLWNLKNLISSAEEGVRILEDKRDALIKELLTRYREVIEERETLRNMMRKSSRDLALALGLDGREILRSLSFAAKRTAMVEVIERNIWGVKFPELHYKSLVRRIDTRGYTPGSSSSITDRVAMDFESILNLVLETASTELYMKRMGEEVRKTSRRINAINEVIIPESKAQLVAIKRVLEEREREDTLRLKKLKSKKGGI